MAKNEAQIIENYQQTRRQLEADEDLLKAAKQKGAALVQETLATINQILQRFDADSELYQLACQSVQQVESDYCTTIAAALKNIDQQYETAEQDYRKALRQADNNL